MLFNVVYFVIVLFLRETVCQLHKVNLNRCKLSHSGVEFGGHLYKTESGLICQEWSSNHPQKVHPSILHSHFVDGSKTKAKNYCRNPNEMFSGPWCYTVNEDVSDELCDVPLCSSDCRITIAGNEYGGNASMSQTNRKCLGWSEKQLRRYENRTAIQTSDRILRDDKFPEKSRKKADNRCRNPTSDPNGLWCFVEGTIGDTEIYEKEYCDVDFCDPVSQCSFATGLSSTETNYHSHFIKLTNKTTSLTMTVQLWNMADFKNASFRIAFSVLPLPLNGEYLFELKTGIEFVIKTNGVGFTGSNGKIQEWKEVHGLLSGISGKKFIFDWLPDKHFVSVTVPEGEMIYYDYVDIKNKDEILQNWEGSWFSYFSIQGIPALWNVPCQQETACEEHITLTPSCNTHKKMLGTNFDYTISFFVRSAETVSLELRNGPASKYPYFRIDILGPFNKTILYVVTEKGTMPKYLSSVSYETIISNLQWTEFYLSTIEDRLQFTWIKQIISSEMLFNVRHPLVRNTKWFSICSKSVAQWAIKCFRNEMTPAPTSGEPECIKTPSAPYYFGTQWVSKSGQPCLPWMYSQIRENTKLSILTDELRKLSRNYCRNPTNDENGPFCYVVDKSSLPTFRVKKEYCEIPKCLGTDCKISGTGLEYEGNLKITRSNKTCILSEDYLENNPSENSLDEKVYCQNPDDNPFGPWCKTTDAHMTTDLCNLPDCSVNDACTIVLRTLDAQWRKMYFYSHWMMEKFTFKIKTWNPNGETAVAINMFFSDTPDWFYSLVIGNENQTKVQLFYIEDKFGSQQKLKLLREKIIPRIIPSGYWQSFWLQVPEKDIELGFEGSKTPIFSWSAALKEPNMLYGYTAFISFHTLSKYDIGLNFPCSYCLMERCMAELEDAFYPMNLWSESNSPANVLTLSMRSASWYGYGEVRREDNAHTFIKFYEDNQRHFLSVMMNYTSIELLRENPSNNLGVMHMPNKILQSNFWTVLKIEYSDERIEISNQFGPLLKYYFDDRKFRFYYFTVVAFREITTWVANCGAIDFNPPFAPGGWSDWTEVCNVPCGGGLGFRQRFCNNPKPHVLGLPCSGPSTIEGECNQFECGCLNPKTIEKAEHLLTSRAHNENVTEYDDLNLDCEYDIFAAVKNDSPTSQVMWLKDGFKMWPQKLKLENRDFNETRLKIENVQVHHSGIYMCVIYPDCAANENEFEVMNVISVVVLTKKVISIRTNSTFRLVCNSPALQYFYNDLHQDWKLDDFSFVDYSAADLTEVNYEYIHDVEPYHSGVWQCYVNQTKLNLMWLTNQIHVEGAPTLLTHLVEDDAPSIIFHGWNLVFVTIFLYFVIAVEIGLVFYAVIWYWRVRTELLAT